MEECDTNREHISHVQKVIEKAQFVTELEKEE